MNEEEMKEEVRASRGGESLSQTDISDTKEEHMKRREGHCLEPEEEEEGGSFNHTIPYPSPKWGRPIKKKEGGI